MYVYSGMAADGRNLFYSNPLASIKAIPYFLRANRGEGEMVVWLLG